MPISLSGGSLLSVTPLTEFLLRLFPQPAAARCWPAVGLSYLTRGLTRETRGDSLNRFVWIWIARLNMNGAAHREACGGILKCRFALRPTLGLASLQRLFVACCWLLGVWLSFSLWFSVIRHLLVVICCLFVCLCVCLFVCLCVGICYLSFAVCCLLFAVRCLLSVACCLLFVAWCVSFMVWSLLSVVGCLLFVAFCRLPITCKRALVGQQACDQTQNCLLRVPVHEHITL